MKYVITSIFMLTVLLCYAQKNDSAGSFEDYQKQQENDYSQFEQQRKQEFKAFIREEIRWHEVTTGNKVSDYSDIAKQSKQAEKEAKYPDKKQHEKDRPEDNNIPVSPSKLSTAIPGGNPLKNFKRFSSEFGYRNHPILKKRMFHPGIDIAAVTGTKIHASADGQIIHAGVSPTYGKFILIRHNNNYRTTYAHCSKLLVKKGQKIKKGHIIGLVGSTGRSTGPHLHYEVIKNGKKINPRGFL